MKSLYKRMFWVAVLALGLAATADNIVAADSDPWVQVSGRGFVKDGKPFKFVGATSVYLVFYDDWELDLEKAIRTAKENNISVLRLYIDLGWGKESDFDKVFDMASKHGVYVMLAFTDCCCSTDCPNLKKYFEVQAPFCNITNKNSVKAFKNLIKRVIERKNSINGKLYRDDPTIIAWEIANELEYWHFSRTDVHNWLKDISSFIKSLDKKHLVTIGISTDGPGFIKDGLIYKMFDAPELDFFSFHVYPSSADLDISNGLISNEALRKIEVISKNFLDLGKPVILGEFGLSGSVDFNFRARNNKDARGLYTLALKKYMDTAFSAGCSGVMFWGWGVSEEESVPMWWSRESHSVKDDNFCSFLRKYRISQ